MLMCELRALAQWLLGTVLSVTGSLGMAVKPRFPTAYCRSCPCCGKLETGVQRHGHWSGVGIVMCISQERRGARQYERSGQAKGRVTRRQQGKQHGEADAGEKEMGRRHMHEGSV